VCGTKRPRHSFLLEDDVSTFACSLFFGVRTDPMHYYNFIVDFQTPSTANTMKNHNQGKSYSVHQEEEEEEEPGLMAARATRWPSSLSSSSTIVAAAASSSSSNTSTDNEDHRQTEESSAAILPPRIVPLLFSSRNISGESLASRSSPSQLLVDVPPSPRRCSGEGGDHDGGAVDDDHQVEEHPQEPHPIPPCFNQTKCQKLKDIVDFIDSALDIVDGEDDEFAYFDYRRRDGLPQNMTDDDWIPRLLLRGQQGGTTSEVTGLPDNNK
jgi:hypothetical protein